MNELNKKDLQKLFLEDDIFSNLEDDMKKAINDRFKVKLNLEEIDFKVARDFLKYLIISRKQPIEKYVDSLILYLKVLAALNRRKTIVQSDLILMIKINMQELGIDDWTRLINSAIKDTMFRKYTIILDQNNDIKENMGLRMEKGKLTKDDIKQAQQQVKWLNESIKQVEGGQKLALESKQLINVFFQEDIYNIFKNAVNDLLGRMKFQKLNFTMVMNYEK